MDCKFTCFDRVLYNVKELPKDKIDEAILITIEDGLLDLLDFCVDNNCFTKGQADTLYEGIIMWEDLDGNYYEEDIDKLYLLYDKIGLTNENIDNYYTKLED